MYLILLQVSDTTSVAAGGGESLSILELLMKGGLLFIIPLLLLSILTVYFFIERYVKIRKAGRFDEGFKNQVQAYMLNGNIKEAIDYCQKYDTPMSHMIEKGVRRIGKPLRSIEVAIENEGKIELLKLEKNLAIIATIAGAAPMIGFLGTVTGMITAFFNISQAGSNVDPGMLAGGIYQALITTALGLTIGIMAYIGYNILVAMIQNVIQKMEITSVDFIDFLQEPAK